MLKLLRSPEIDANESIPQGIDSASLCSLVKIDSLELIPGVLKKFTNSGSKWTPSHIPPPPPPPHPKIGTYFTTKKWNSLRPPLISPHPLPGNLYFTQCLENSQIHSVGRLGTHTARKMYLILRSIERRPHIRVQFSMARKFTLWPLRRYSVNHSKMCKYVPHLAYVYASAARKFTHIFVVLNIHYFTWAAQNLLLKTINTGGAQASVSRISSLTL